jgi:hypothetical protein
VCEGIQPRINNAAVIPSPEFPIGSNVLITYPTNFRPKLSDQLRGPFTVVSVEKSMYMLRPYVEHAKLLALHASRLVPVGSDVVDYEFRKIDAST